MQYMAWNRFLVNFTVHSVLEGYIEDPYVTLCETDLESVMSAMVIREHLNWSTQCRLKKPGHPLNPPLHVHPSTRNHKSTVRKEHTGPGIQQDTSFYICNCDCRFVMRLVERS